MRASDEETGPAEAVRAGCGVQRQRRVALDSETAHFVEVGLCLGADKYLCLGADK
ncbi:hypothetical protein [Streptomyces capitiformicae]|uniref:Uncharacterized protein n=1 Tax=Streptomyces capitiformicae TaxID=2014920 RepID=A0A919DBY2_9ACTN|nr:hypothetical protein [Streptomyces capitiformicae]GHE33001.1 hypothetical protein GCM10017771_49950 [Streptomyces capitiformicae]